MRVRVAAVVRRALEAAVAAGQVPPGLDVPCGVAPPERPEFGDFACAAPIEVARQTGMAAPAVAAVLLRHLQAPQGWFSSVEIGGPGFLNVRVGWRLLGDAACAVTEGLLVPAPTADRQRDPIVAITDGLDRSLMTRARLEAVAHALRALLGNGAEGPTRRVEVVGAEGRPTQGGARHVSVGPVRTFRDGARTDQATLPRARRHIAGLRYLLLAEPVGHEIDLDLEAAEGETFESPVFAVRYALARVAGWAVPHPSPPVLSVEDLAGVGSAERQLLWVIATWPDVRDEAALSLEPSRLVAFATEVAAAIHGYYNRSPIMMDEAPGSQARRTTLQAAGRVLERALMLVGIDLAGRE